VKPVGRTLQDRDRQQQGERQCHPEQAGEVIPVGIRAAGQFGAAPMDLDQTQNRLEQRNQNDREDRNPGAAAMAAAEVPREQKVFLFAWDLGVGGDAENVQQRGGWLDTEKRLQSGPTQQSQQQPKRGWRQSNPGSIRRRPTGKTRQPGNKDGRIQIALRQAPRPKSGTPNGQRHASQGQG
jgi:hypothetical protein